MPRCSVVIVGVYGVSPRLAVSGCAVHFKPVRLIRHFSEEATGHRAFASRFLTVADLRDGLRSWWSDPSQSDQGCLSSSALDSRGALIRPDSQPQEVMEHETAHSTNHKADIRIPTCRSFPPQPAVSFSTSSLSLSLTSSSSSSSSYSSSLFHL
ncbi:unnamed protein product [Pleuronectes platessa]|uniref:Uncharacterized protein n=1 Tax=Pleuronectes platessa TaxID=8262 RepID=A0A9N7UIM1_PLEPL|nr:unnamed protein product [Pleuronectes platessa]